MSNQMKLLEGLSGENITVTIRSLAKYMASNGVIVTVTVGRARGYIPMPGKAYGIDLDAFSEKGSTFFSERVSQSHINFIPPEDEAAFANIEKRLRRAVEVRTLADGFMPTTAYDDLKKEFADTRALYFAKRDEVLAKWDSLVASFKEGAEEMLAGIRIPNAMQEALLKEFLGKVPDKDYYKASFVMGLKVKAFPAEAGNLPGLNSSIEADMRESWKEDVVSTAILSIEQQVGEGWEKMMGAMRQYVKGNAIKSSSIVAIQNFAKQLEWKNVFRNPLLCRLNSSLANLQTLSAESQAMAIEEALTYTYGYAKEAHLDLDFNKCPYRTQDLENMLQLSMGQLAIDMNQASA